MLIPDRVKALAMAALLGLAFAAGWLVRGWRTDAIQSRAVATQAGNQVASVHRQDAATAKIDASATTQVEKTRIVYRTIHDEVLKYVQKTGGSAGVDCLLDAQWVQLHDDAAIGRSPDASGAVDASRAQAGRDR